MLSKQLNRLAICSLLSIGIQAKAAVPDPPPLDIPKAVAVDTPQAVPPPVANNDKLLPNWNAGWAAFQKEDYTLALRHFLPLAEQGDSATQVNLGFMYEQGKGVKQDDAEAVSWYRKSAEQGNAVAQNNLGLMYEQGKGVKQSKATAIEWYEKAALQGDEDAKRNLQRLQAKAQ
jgi:TPR repeat protein